MCCKGFFKRFAPFFLTFAVGLFIASFFVAVAAPNFSFRRGGFNRHREYDRQRESELRQLRIEKSRLESDLEKEKIKNQSSYTHDWEGDSEYPLIRRNQNFQPRIEDQDLKNDSRKVQ
ncbi:hypothetical protein BH10ACI1_BH10ACI1_16570 [soil metagenome]